MANFALDDFTVSNKMLKNAEPHYLPEILLLHELVKNMDDVEFRLRWAGRFSTAKIEALTESEIKVHTGIEFTYSRHSKYPESIIAVPNLDSNGNRRKIPPKGIPGATYEESMGRYILFMTMVLDAERH
jgi:hypothetical protein